LFTIFQLQVQRTSAIKPSKINKIFLTHAHGDHTFGLPGLLCLMGQDREQNVSRDIIDIYGPEGLRMWLRVTIRYSVSRIVPPYRVHEIMDIPMAPEWEFNPRIRRYYYKEKGMPGKLQWTRKGLAGEDPLNWISQANQLDLELNSMYGEVEGGTDIYPDYNHPKCVQGAPIWKVVEEDDASVYAAPMNHGIPCLGFVVQEQSRPGRLRKELVEPIVRSNAESLRRAGYTVPMKVMSVIKNLRPGASFTFPDGNVVKQEDVVEPQRNGRKIVICGDTCDSSTLRGLAMDADVVVHEATNSYLQGIDSRDSSIASVTRDAVVHGHSTPQIAGAFAKSVRAKCLLLNHFSSRYKGDPSVASLSIMMRIERVAMAASDMKESQVAAAWDLMVLSVPASKG
jgi:ribonuclease Z